MKKKLMSAVAILLVAFMIFAFAGCKEKTLSAEDVFAKVREKMSDVSDIDTSLDMDISMELKYGEGNETKQTISATFDLKAKNVSSENPTVWIKLEANAMGEKQKGEMYIEDKISYVNENGEKYKQPVDESNKDDAFEDVDIEKLTKLIKDSLEDAKVEKNDDGDAVITVKISGKKFMEVIAEATDEDFDELEEAGINLDTDNFKLKFTVDEDNYLTKIEGTFGMKMTNPEEDDQEINISIKIKAEINNPGEAVEITPPAGYKNYPSRSENGGWNEF